MAKQKIIYICSNCGAKSPKWLGRCNSCNEWNTFEEETESINKNVNRGLIQNQEEDNKPKLLNDIQTEKEKRIDTKSAEFNRVLGGGLVSGSIVLVGGEPGIGKSTLALQLALKLNDAKILYVSGEESLLQIKMRAERIGTVGERCFFLSATSMERITKIILKFKPDLLIIDSIQTLNTETVESSAGSITQIRECANILLNYAKKTNTPIIIIGHINKEGNIAGPKVLEHVVDTVLQFEGDNNHLYRILRATKNRFGSTSEIGIFEMRQNGLREVSNPSEMLLSENKEDISGVSIAASIEGIRPFLIEIQSLVSSAAYGTPQRTATGFNLRRLSMLLAVLEKRAGFRLSTKDVFLNIAGGLKVDDPATDLSVICSVLSSDLDMAIPKNFCFAGEVSLSGEIRPVTRLVQRISEAQKLGFKKIFISKFTKGIDIDKYKIKIETAAKVEDVFRKIFSE